MTGLPHGVPPNSSRRNGGNNILFATSKQCFLVLATAIPSFLLGTTVALYARLDGSTTMIGTANAACPGLDGVVQARVAQAVAAEKRLWMQECNNNNPGGNSNQQALPATTMADASKVLLNKQKVGNYVTSVALTPKANLTSLLDLGVPLDPVGKKGSSHAMILYMKQGDNKAVEGKILDQPDAAAALAPCETVHVLLTDHSGKRNQCLAIVPNYESYYLQRWMRIGPSRKTDPSAPLQLVGRGLKGGVGTDEFKPPTKANAQKAVEFFQKYFASLDDVLSELSIILKRIATADKTVIVMVCNFGQSELLLNFICQARARKLDISNIIVFATDQQTYDMVQGIGVAAFYDKRNFGDLPLDAAHRYGDRYFTGMMLAKVVCVQLVSMLGYSFLFQDVDMVWFKHPLDYFKTTKDDFDIYFQDDGGHSLRYAPYSANTGFYFARHNDRTQRFFTSVLMNADMTIQTFSHQQALIAVLNEHVSLHGLKVKVYARDTDDFPGGFQWNQPSHVYMRKYFAGEVEPYIFHMSWTLNKDNKVLYFKQFGEWWVQDQCVQNQKVGAFPDVASSCCLAEPLFECHYRDKPSKFPCKDSPPIDEGRPSFWK